MHLKGRLEGNMIQLLNIIETFDTTLGKILLVKGSKEFRVGEKIQIPLGVFTIKGIQMPTRPTDDDTVGLIVSDSI